MEDQSKMADEERVTLRTWLADIQSEIYTTI